MAGWAAELHPLFCGHPVGCGGHHVSEVSEVDTGHGPFILASAQMDTDGRVFVPLTVETAGSNDEVRLTVAAAEHLGLALLAKVGLTRNRAAMVPSALLNPPTVARTATGPSCPAWCVDCDRERFADGLVLHNGPAARIGAFTIAAERLDESGTVGDAQVHVNGDSLTPADARALAAALVRAADVAEGR